MPAFLRLLFAAVLATLFTPALADAGAPAPGVGSGGFLQATLGLFLIIALMFGLAYLARKLNIGRGFGQGGMRLLGGIALGPKERIMLVEAGDVWLVIGIVPGQIRTLHTLPKGTIETKVEPGAPAFASWLKQIAERRGHEQ